MHNNRFNLFSRSIAWTVTAAILIMVAAVSSASSQQPQTADDADRARSGPGLVQQRPSEGRFVELENGIFMVPYQATIPGTEVKFTMVPIPGGKFMMGSPESDPHRRDDEGPQVEIEVQPFWIGQHEVTWREYRQYMELDEHFKKLASEGMRQVTEENEIDGVTAPSGLYDPSFTFEAGEAPGSPAASMTQFAAKQYTKWLSLISSEFYRLPTEAEWEYACRAGTTTTWYFGDDEALLDDHAWHIDNADWERHEVGQLKPNPWGLYDMYGNVNEWVLDQYSNDTYEQLAGKTTAASKAWLRPTQVSPRVLRGGSWELEPGECRSAARVGSDDRDWQFEDPNFPKSPWWYTDSPGLGVGFRIIRPLEPAASRQEQELVWGPDVRKIKKDAMNRIESNGRGSWGIVDGDLPKDIASLKE